MSVVAFNQPFVFS